VIYQFLEPSSIEQEPEQIRDIAIVMFIDIPKNKGHIKSTIMPPLSSQVLKE
jgi:hypothetical protein